MVTIALSIMIRIAIDLAESFGDDEPMNARAPAARA